MLTNSRFQLEWKVTAGAPVKGHGGRTCCRWRWSLIGHCFKIVADSRPNWGHSQFIHTLTSLIDLARVFTRQTLAPQCATRCRPTSCAINRSCKPAFTLHLQLTTAMEKDEPHWPVHHFRNEAGVEGNLAVVGHCRWRWRWRWRVDAGPMLIENTLEVRLGLELLRRHVVSRPCV